MGTVTCSCLAYNSVVILSIKMQNSLCGVLWGHVCVCVFVCEWWLIIFPVSCLFACWFHTLAAFYIDIFFTKLHAFLCFRFISKNGIMFGVTSTSSRLAMLTRTVRSASMKRADPVRDAFLSKLKEYAKKRNPSYTQEMIKKILEGRVKA